MRKTKDRQKSDVELSKNGVERDPQENQVYGS